MTWGRHSAMASATAREPSVCLSMGALPHFHREVVGFFRRFDILFGDDATKLLPDGGEHRLYCDQTRDRGEPAEQRGIRHGAADVLQGELGRGKRAENEASGPLCETAQA